MPSHLFFYLGGSFYFCRRKIYITLTVLTIVTTLSFQNLYAGVARYVVHVATGFIIPGAHFSDRCCVGIEPGPVLQGQQKAVPPIAIFSLGQGASVFRQGHRDHMGDIATSVHKVPENKKKT
ncbi:hypothetical protein [Pseudomonas asturiensis]|uniref:hypothetical protein n=1 Tax=Pseudomonas asturiensis TaxID=1190415 RepID=UPI001132831D|nr:hypothetical protein [Pseudomonas asturiensis]